MLNHIRQNIKYLSLILVAFVLIIINSASLIENLTKIKRKGIIRRPVNPVNFYDKNIPEFEFYSKKGETLKLPDDKNHIIFGLNNKPENTLGTVNLCMINIESDNFNIDINAVTHLKEIKNNYNIEIFHYDPLKLGDFFHLSDNQNFTLLIDKTNKIKYFDYRLISIYEFDQLVSNYK